MEPGHGMVIHLMFSLTTACGVLDFQELLLMQGPGLTFALKTPAVRVISLGTYVRVQPVAIEFENTEN